jgi:hypothetical protein
MKDNMFIYEELEHLEKKNSPELFCLSKFKSMKEIYEFFNQDYNQKNLEKDIKDRINKFKSKLKI